MHQDLLNDLINSLTILPGVGKKSAQRMALYLLDKNKDGARILAKTLEKAIDEIGRCTRCRMLTSNSLCKICSDNTRDMNSICVVENPSDVLAIESTGGFKGRYFVLLGRLSPIDGISPDDIGINDFLKLIEIENILEAKKIRDIDAKLIGINNRNLKEQKIDINKSIKLSKVLNNKIIISESGITVSNIKKIKNNSAISSFLIGGSILNNEDKVKYINKLYKA